MMLYASFPFTNTAQQPTDVANYQQDNEQGERANNEKKTNSQADRAAKCRWIKPNLFLLLLYDLSPTSVIWTVYRTNLCEHVQTCAEKETLHQERCYANVSGDSLLMTGGNVTKWTNVKPAKTVFVLLLLLFIRNVKPQPCSKVRQVCFVSFTCNVVGGKHKE